MRLADATRLAPWATPAALASCVTSTWPQPWQRAPHLDLISQHLAEACWRRGQRVLIMAPPRHGKSELCCVWLPLWYLSLWPHHHVLLTSYEREIAARWGRRARELAAALGLALAPDATASWRWHTRQGGSMVALGAGGAILGRGADLVIIDDPVKNAEAAYSPTQREHLWVWYRSVVETRLEPGAVVVIAMARWHPDDLVGRLLREEARAWTILRLPALAEADDPLGRAPGEALWPARWPRPALEAIAHRQPSRLWRALYQQAPVGGEDEVFPEEAIQRAARADLALEGPRWACRVCGATLAPTERCPTHQEPARRAEYLTAWDLARTQDWTVGITIEVGTTPYRIVAFERFQRRPWPAVVAAIRQRADRYGGLTLVDATGVGDAVLAMPDMPAVIPVVFTASRKLGMLTALEALLERGDLVGPADLDALWSELRAYRWEDRDLVTDCVMALAMAAWWLMQPQPQILRLTTDTG